MAENEYKRLGCAVEGCALPVGVLTGRGRPPKRCSEHIYGKITRENKECPACLGFFTPARDGQIFCTKLCGTRLRRGCRPKGTTDEYVCEFCGFGFSAEQKARFCSKSCKTKAWQKANPEVTKQRAREYSIKSTNKHRITDEEKAKRKAERVANKIPVDAVAQKARYKAQADAKNRSLHAQDAKVVACEECGLEFCPLYGSSHATLCMCCKKDRAKASRAATRLVRELRLSSNFVERVDPYKVFHAAGWLCQICGVPTPKAKRGTYDDDAPELDHIHPLSKGGAHSYENTQCSCRKCNGKKSDQIWQRNLSTLTPLPVP